MFKRMLFICLVLSLALLTSSIVIAQDNILLYGGN